VQSKRSRWELIYDVLKITYEEKRSNKTRIMQRAHLDWRAFKKYFEVLIDKGFITKCISIPDNYEITEKGMKLLESFRKIDEIRTAGEMLG
jgi:predicted transcriptional regulator